MNVNFMTSLIKHIKKGKSCYLKFFLTYRKFSLSTNILYPPNINMETTKKMDPKTNDNKVKINNKKRVLSNSVNTIKGEYNDSLNIRKYVRSIKPQYVQICPKKYLTCSTKTSNVLYLVSESGAKNFVDLIIDDLSKNMTFVAEANPGTGVLTEQLLKAGIKFIHLYEPNECFYPILLKLQDKYPNRLELRKKNIMNMNKMYFMDLQDNKERVNEILKDVLYVPWENESCMQFIGGVTNLFFLKHLIWSVVFRTSFMLRGRTSFYLAIAPSLWNTLNFPQQRAVKYFLYIMYQTLFDCKYFGDLERLLYIPWLKLSSNKNKATFNDNKILKIVKIEPKVDLFKYYINPTQIIPYWYFVKYHLKSRKQRVIPELERWIPGCGIRLIQKDYNIFTRFVDLTPVEFLNLFKEFASWPEYENCLFLSSAHSYIHILNRNMEYHKLNLASKETLDK